MSVNKVILLGNTGRDPEVKYFDNGGVVATITLATTENGYTTKDGREVPEKTEWHSIVLYNGIAKVAEKFVKKGDRLYIDGKLRTRSYDDANGVKKYVTEVICDKMEILTPKRASDNPTPPPPDPINNEPPKNDDLPF